MIDLPTRIQRYLDSCPGAVSGQGGHNQTFFVACKLYHGFALSETDAFNYLKQYNEKCSPKWSDRELLHKIQSAVTAQHTTQRGHMLNGAVWSKADFSPVPVKSVAKVSEPPKYKKDPRELPAAMADATKRILEIAFGEGEGVAICRAEINADGKSVPVDSGVVHTREEWLEKLTDAPGLFVPSDGGWFVRVNPMKLGGNKDADVTAYRHVLIEFDQCSVEEQWSLIQQSNVPCTAVLTSGNKSLHAWVRVDAKDGAEYASRAKVLMDHFADYGVDPKNKNASRFSRLPGTMRGDKEQSLLAVHIGAHSFEQWLIDAAAAGIGEQFHIKDLMAFEPKDDPTTVLGSRWLCRGGSCLWVGQSGVGKSSLSMQAAVRWGYGMPFFGVRPVKPLKSLIIQAENDMGDTAEMLKGVLMGTKDAPDGAAQMILQNLVIVRDESHSGFSFAQAAQKLIEKHRPDLVWVDPLLSFFGDDINNQKACSQFLRSWLNPIASSSGIIWMLLHHTAKPPKEHNARKGWTSTDYSYMGTGSSELTNWARAVVCLHKIDESTFKLMFAKRGGRAGAKTLDDISTIDVYLQHAQSGICWEQCDEPEEDAQDDENMGKKLDAVFAEIGSRHMKHKEVHDLIKKHFAVGNTKASEILKEQAKNRGLKHDKANRLYHL